MTQWHMKSRRKESGGTDRSVDRSDKRLAWKGNDPILTTIDKKEERKKVKGYGRTKKVKLKAAKTIYAVDKSTGKKLKCELITVVENNADRQFARQNIITKGAIVKAKTNEKEVLIKVASRPGQTGSLSGFLLENEKEVKKTGKKQKKESKTPKTS
ncbi:MAG: 30S ribosomal protein S8e [Candidatus Diapherotrites archaeon]